MRQYQLICKEIIQAPAKIPFPAIVLERPPGVVTGSLVKHSERISKPEIDKVIDLCRSSVKYQSA